MHFQLNSEGGASCQNLSQIQHKNVFGGREGGRKGGKEGEKVFSYLFFRADVPFTATV